MIRMTMTIASMLLICAVSAQTFMNSVNVYRIPYEDGTIVNISRDHQSHSPPGRIDMTAESGTTNIVAAADGIIEAIVDDNTQSCVCCPEFNNYVWIKHVNGEWTKYTHFVTGSVTVLGHEVGDAILSGTVLGQEGDVGCADGIHLHFEVAYPTTDQDPPFNPVGGGMIEGNAVNRIPTICGIPDYIFEQDEEYLAITCISTCPTNWNYSVPSLFSGATDVIMVDNEITASGTHNMFSGSSALFRAGNQIILGPGVKIYSGSRFNALIRVCNANQ